VKELVVFSNQGGISGIRYFMALAAAARPVVLVDCSFRGPTPPIDLSIRNRTRHDLLEAGKATIHRDKCDACGNCMDFCRYGAVYCHREDGKPLSETYYIDDLRCEGCDACAHFCPSGAIVMKSSICGSWYRSESQAGPLVHGRLSPGLKVNSRHLATLRTQAREIAVAGRIELIIAVAPIDNSVWTLSMLSRADFALFLVEPGRSAVRDLGRMAQAARDKGIPTGVCFPVEDDTAAKRAGHSVKEWSGLVDIQATAALAGSAGGRSSRLIKADGDRIADFSDLWRQVSACLS